MKKIKLFAAAAMMLAACSNESDVYTGTQQEIGVSGLSQKSTRAVVSGTSLVDGSELPMWIHANYKDANSNYSKYIDNAEFIYEGNDLWKGKKPYYYPIDGTTNDKMDFMAYSLSKNASKGPSNPPTAVWSPDANVNNFTGETTTKELLKLTNLSLDGETDVMYSDPCIGNSCPAANAPTLTFHHALAWLYFNFTQGTISNVIKVKSIMVNDVSISGDVTVNYNYNSTPTPSYETSVGWTNLSTAAARKAFKSASTDGDDLNNTTQLNGSLLVPVQSRKSFTITYTLNNGGTVSPDLTYTYPAATENWEAGKKYIYVITITLTEIKVKAVVTGYEENPNIDVPIQ